MTAELPEGWEWEGPFQVTVGVNESTDGSTGTHIVEERYQLVSRLLIMKPGKGGNKRYRAAPDPRGQLTLHAYLTKATEFTGWMVTLMGNAGAEGKVNYIPMPLEEAKSRAVFEAMALQTENALRNTVAR